jgi:LmbE family N-acetylglucosaminyl deacetylase
MRVLIVAHPDDEILWFAAETFDRIIIVHQGRKDNALQGGHRAAALAAHPLKDRITCLGLTESNYWRDPSQKAHHEQNYTELCAFLRDLQADEVTTHNANGEYGHADHIMVHNACMATLYCPVNGKDPATYRAAKRAYEDNGCWTWH